MPSDHIERDLAELVADAATPSLEEVLERAGRRTGGTVPFADAVEGVREDRDGRRARAPGTRCEVEVLR